MADGHGHFNPSDNANNAGSAGSGDASNSFQRELASMRDAGTRPGDTVARVGDNTAGQPATPTDSRGYDTAMLQGTSDAFQAKYFGGSAADNLAATNAGIQDKVASLSSPTNSDSAAHLAAIQDTVAHYAAQTPGFAQNVKTA